MPFLQVTLGAAATRVITTRTPCKQIIFQNTASNVCRVGDSTVTASKGIKLAGSAADNSILVLGPFDTHPLELEDYYIFGTANDLIDVWYT